MDDYISREAAIEAHCMNCQYIDQEDDKSACWCMEKDRINRIPAADVRPVKRGEWLDVAGDQKCSVCGMSFPDLYPLYDSARFCPNCGAQMTEARHGSP